MSSKSIRRCPSVSACGVGLAFALSLFLSSGVLAQDAVRPSLAGEAAAEARRQSLDRIPYNLLLGEVRFRVSATAGFEYNDNINVAEFNPQDDFIFRPSANLNVLWPVTQLNTLRLDLGLGYAFYANHSEDNTNTVLLSPGSQLSFDIFVSDFRINFHDRFSLQQDPADEPALSNVVDYGRFENTAGVSVLWDLNKVVVTVGYDHYNFISTTDAFEYLDRNSEIFMGSVSFAATSTTGVGLEATYVLNRYDEARGLRQLNDSESFNLGAFVETQLTENLRLRVAGGYQVIDFDDDVVFLGLPSGLNPFADQDELEDYYANLLITHRINAAISHQLSIGHESQLGVNSNFITLNYIRHSATWNIINRTLLQTEFFYMEADESGGIIDEHFHRYGGALSVGYQLTTHVTLGARYQYTEKDSDAFLRDYTQNRISLDGTYSF